MVDGAELQQRALDTHQRLLRRDPAASLDAADLLLDPLVKRLRTKWPGVTYLDACYDAAVEVIVTYLEAPDRYDPARSALLTWLSMQAHGDLLNDYASPQKAFERDWLVESALSREPDADASKLVHHAQALGASDLAAPRKIVKVAEIPVLGTGKTDYVALTRTVEAEAKAA